MTDKEMEEKDYGARLEIVAEFCTSPEYKSTQESPFVIWLERKLIHEREEHARTKWEIMKETDPYNAVVKGLDGAISENDELKSELIKARERINELGKFVEDVYECKYEPDKLVCMVERQRQANKMLIKKLEGK